MTEKRLKEIYKVHAENTAPDMDALWEKIESGLEEKNESGVTSKPIRRKISMTKTAALTAACIAALIIVPVAVRNLDISNEEMTASMDNGNYAEVQADGAANDAVPKHNSAEEDTIAADFAAEEAEAITDKINNAQTVYYEKLSLAQAEPIYEIPDGKTGGDDFFVEDSVLIETDMIVNAYIDRVYSSGSGAMCYEIIADDLETGETENILLVSATPYVMLENRSYVLPLKNSEDGYSLVFENAPQIERTLDGGLIFHNGWQTLDVDSADVIYPQGKVDDFFYDRMKFSYADVNDLVAKWHKLKD